MNHIDSNRINGIINFMRYCTSIVDPDEALEKNGIVNIDNFSETQLVYCIEKYGVNNLDIKTLFQSLSKLDTPDIRLINSDKNIFNFFMLVAGGLYYAKSIRRLIKKSDIIAIKEILNQNIYDFIFKFSMDTECLEDYPLFDDFENRLLSMGYRILFMYLETMNPMLVYFLTNKIDLQPPKLDSKNLRISNEYAVKLAITTRDFIISQSE